MVLIMNSHSYLDDIDDIECDNCEKQQENDYVVDLDKLFQSGRITLSFIDASKFVNYTVDRINVLVDVGTEIRKLIFFIVYWRLHESLKCTRNDLMNRLVPRDKVHRDTVHRYITAAILENDLNITNGLMAVDALVELNRTSKETGVRKQIFQIATQFYQSKKPVPKRYRSKKPKPYPTKTDIIRATEAYKASLKCDSDWDREAIVNAKIQEFVIEMEKNNKTKKDKLLDVRTPKNIRSNTWDSVESIEQENAERMKLKDRYLDLDDDIDREEVWDQKRKKCNIEINSCSMKEKKALRKSLTNNKKSQNKVTTLAKSILAYNNPDEINKIIKSLKTA